MRAWMIAGAVLGLAGCGGGLEPQESAFLDGLRAEFDKQLLDYPSARFRDVRMTDAGGVVCGFVNSKNRMGAYAGWSKFMGYDGVGGEPVMLLISQGEGDEPCPVEEDWRPDDLSDRLAPKA